MQHNQNVGQVNFDSLLNVAGPRLVFRTQITPDFTFSLAPGAPVQATPDEDPGVGGQFAMWFLRNIIKPEIQVQAIGLQKNLAPFGRPTRNLAFPLAIGLFSGAAAVGGALFLLARRRRRAALTEK